MKPRGIHSIIAAILLVLGINTLAFLFSWVVTSIIGTLFFPLTPEQTSMVPVILFPILWVVGFLAGLLYIHRFLVRTKPARLALYITSLVLILVEIGLPILLTWSA